MISENLKNCLLERAIESQFDFQSLISFMENSKFEFIGGEVYSATGVATYNKAYFDLKTITHYDDQYIFFLILHEYCHMLVINKIGFDGIINQLKESDINIFTNNFIKEEILADRFGRIWFYKMTKKLFPYYRTQQLEKLSNRLEYELNISELFGKIKDEESYIDNLYFFVKDWRPIEEYKPIWYKNVELLLKDGTIKREYHRLSSVDNVYYGTLETNDTIQEEEISHWRDLRDE